MSNNPLSFKEFLKKYSYKRSDEIIAYELYLIVQYLKRMLNMEEEKSIKKEELIQNELTKVRLIEANERLKEIAMKTEYEKEDYADADVIAVFENLGITIYIQVKKHIDKTDQWAVEQISKYKDQQEKRFIDGVSYVPWVVTTADDFTQSARELAKTLHVRLINGKEFARMLAEVGVNGISDDF